MRNFLNCFPHDSSNEHTFFLSFHKQTIFFPQVAEQTIYFHLSAEQLFSQKTITSPQETNGPPLKNVVRS